MQIAPRYSASNRLERRTFRNLVAQVIYHHEDAERQPETARERSFVCRQCRHVLALCTCQKAEVK